MKFSNWLESSWCSAGYPINKADLFRGKMMKWLATLDRLPELQPVCSQFGDTVRVGTSFDVSPDVAATLDLAIESLKPWRKGPLNLFGHEIDSEWRSNLKWDRLRGSVAWTDKDVLDVGCGNGYYGFRAIESGANSVLGLDGYVLYVLQAALVNWFVRSSNVVVPLRLEDCSTRDEFDIVLSMGVIYHQRDADSHLRALFERCRPGGQVVLESIVAAEDFIPKDRYAGMRNVFLIPSVQTLETKLHAAGFRDPTLIDVSKTTSDEQRKTRHMPFHSLSDALDPSDGTLTVEGLPASNRAILIAKRGR